jgi:hypothetical protein
MSWEQRSYYGLMCGKVLLTIRRGNFFLEVVQDWAALEEHHGMAHYGKVRAALVDLQDEPRSHDKGYKTFSDFGKVQHSTILPT